MAKKKMGHFVTLSIMLLSAMSFCGASNVTEAEANTVEVKFYRLQVSDWVSKNMETTFHALLAAEANTYCAANLAACGLDTLISSFKESHIGKIDTSPIDDDKDMLYKFYIKYPESSNVSSSSALQYVLSKAVVENIVLQLRTNVDYITALGCSKCYITYINDDFYGIPPSKENKIIIPIAFAVLLIIIIIAISLHFWNKKKEKQRKWEKRHRTIPKNSPPPEYTKSANPPSHTALPDDKINEPKSRKTKKNKNDLPQSWGVKKKEKMYSSTMPKKQMERSGGASNDSGLDVDAYERRQKPHALEPLDHEADQEVKRKKKKKEKKRSKKSKVEGSENQGYMAEGEDLYRGDMKTEL